MTMQSLHRRPSKIGKMQMTLIFFAMALAPMLNADGLNPVVDARQAIVEVILPKVPARNTVLERPAIPTNIPVNVRRDRFVSIGTAFFVSPKTLVSAAHVFAPFSHELRSIFYVRTITGKIYKVNTISKYSNYQDLVEFNLESYPAIIQPLRLSTEARIGDRVCAVGNALGEGIAVRCGGEIASFTNEPIAGTWRNIRFSTPVSPGNSGGPLLNQRAEVVGVVIQKSRSENLNVATPIGEYLRMRSGIARVYMPNYRIQEESGEISLATLDLRVTLPMRASELFKNFRSRYDQFVTQLFKQHRQRHKETLLPRNPEFRAYLTDQAYSEMPIARLVKKPGNYGGYGIVTGRISELNVDRDRKALIQDFGDQIFYTLKRPKNVELASYFLDAKRVQDDLLQALDYRVNIYGDNIRVLSFGKPLKKRLYRDRYGRSWLVAEFLSSYENAMRRLYCTPNVDSVSCVGDAQHYQQTVDDIFFRETLHNYLITYAGKLEAWKKFVKMEKKWLPESVAKLEWKQDKEDLSIRNPFVSFDRSKVDHQDILRLATGFDPEKPTRLAVRQIEFFPRDRSGLQFRRMALSKPSKLLPRDRYLTVKNLFEGEAPFDGRSPVRQDKAGVVLLKVVDFNEDAASRKMLYACKATSEAVLEQKADDCMP